MCRPSCRGSSRRYTRSARPRQVAPAGSRTGRGWGLASDRSARRRVQEVGGQCRERREAMVGVGAVAEAVGDVDEGDVAIPRRGLVAGGVAHEDWMPELVAVEYDAEVLGLRQAGIAPALEVAKASAELRPLKERLDVARLAVADDEERIAGAEPS